LRATGICSSSAAHRRFQEWTKAGVFERLWALGLQEYDELTQIQWAYQAMDGGHESFIQTVTGMAERFGGAGSSVGQPNAINDYGTGFMGAYGIALALLHRRRTGEGQHVDTSLAYTSMTLQSPFMHEFAGKRWHEGSRRWVAGRWRVHTVPPMAGSSSAPGRRTCPAWPRLRGFTE
jgi:crotonobetainyl-CoA:carnitine CoA-transferase CaiB-like acyl-CoA transferase